MPTRKLLTLVLLGLGLLVACGPAREENTGLLPTATPVPPPATAGPPTATPLAPTSTPALATSLPLPPPATATPGAIAELPATLGVISPTPTPAPATATATLEGPTAPPAATSVPVATETSIVSAGAAAPASAADRDLLRQGFVQLAVLARYHYHVDAAGAGTAPIHLDADVVRGQGTVLTGQVGDQLIDVLVVGDTFYQAEAGAWVAQPADAVLSGMALVPAFPGQLVISAGFIQNPVLTDTQTLQALLNGGATVLNTGLRDALEGVRVDNYLVTDDPRLLPGTPVGAGGPATSLAAWIDPATGAIHQYVTQLLLGPNVGVRGGQYGRTVRITRANDPGLVLPSPASPVPPTPSAPPAAR
ncbi:MAG TPA: hypothetical protein VKY74_13845 [Chloroflexia bacterium]|nr:hypothetical protein [Chloroflexia bacterium]